MEFRSYIFKNNSIFFERALPNYWKVMMGTGLMSFFYLVKREAYETLQAVHHSIDIKDEVPVAKNLTECRLSIKETTAFTTINSDSLNSNEVPVAENLTECGSSIKEETVFTPVNSDSLNGSHEVIEDKMIIHVKVPRKLIMPEQNMQKYSIDPEGVVVPKLTKQLVSIKIICK